MKSLMMILVALGTAGAVTVASASAEAQRIRTYGDQAETGSESRVTTPGAPVRQQEQAPAQEAAPTGEEGGEAGDEAPAGSHRISLYQGDNRASQTQRSQRRQELASRDHTELYRGIIPGKRDEVSHTRAQQRRSASTGSANAISWVGFQPDEERTRIFFKSPHPMEYRVQEKVDSDNLVVVFENARIPERNFQRFIDTSYFDRVVKRVQATETRDGNVEVTLNLRADMAPSITTEGQYLYLDFPHDSGDDEARADADGSDAR